MSADEELPIKPVKATDVEAKPHAVEEFTMKDLVEKDDRPFFFRHVTAIVKFCAVFLVAGMWVCTVFLIQKREETDGYSHWYCLAASTVTTLLEFIWFLNICVCCPDDGGCCCTSWRVLMWLDNWKKGLAYIAVAVPTFIELNLLAAVCGILILVLAFLYIVKSCAECACVGGKKYVRRTIPEDKKQKSQTDPENAAASPSGAGDTH